MSDITDRMQAALRDLAVAAARTNAAWRGLAPTIDRANAEAWVEMANAGDPFARRVLAHAGHPVWNAEMRRRALQR